MAYNLNMTQGEFVTLLDGATSAVASEVGRVTDENTRKANETARKSAETARANAESVRSTSESTRVANENTRITGETGRKNNENVRADSENTRKTAENARVTAESGRSTAETARATEEATRKATETERINGENTRKSAETARANAESGRSTAESARATEEATRKTTENTRINGENTRKTAESGRVTAETARASNEDARKSGESARVASEAVRVDGETGRKNNEATRVDSENTRKTAETERITGENTRRTAETERASETSGIVARATVQANIAGQKAVEAQTSQTNAQASATAAENSRQAIENMTVTGTTVATGGQATVTKTVIGGVANLAFGIPRGIQGVQGAKGDSVYDVVIRTQAEFDALITSPDWLGAESVCFVGDGGTMKFTVAENTGITIPLTVRRLQGANNAILDFTFSNNQGVNPCLQYLTQPETVGYSCSDITVIATPTKAFCGFRAFLYMINITRCNVKAYTHGGNAATNATGYCSCKNLYDCAYEFYYVGDAQYTSAPIKGFDICFNIINPVVKITALNATNGCVHNTSGFHSCSNILNSKLEFDSGDGIRRCKNITNAIVTGKGVGTQLAGLSDCYRIDNCTIYITSTAACGNAYGASECYQISNCDIVAKATGTDVNSTGIAIDLCSYINGCYGKAPSTTAFLSGANTFVDTLTVGS